MKKIIILFLFVLTSIPMLSLDFQTMGPGGGGCFYYPSINPQNAKDIFLPSDNSNMFRTTDQGASWKMYPYSSLRSISASKVCFTSDAKIMYTVNNDFGANLYVPTKSTDAGNTWTSLENDPTFGNTYYIFTDESASNRLVIASDYEVFFSSDGGNSFNSIYEGDILGTGAYLAGAFFDGQKIVIALGDGFLESSDGGANFTKTVPSGLGTDEYLYSFVGVKVGMQTVFYCVTVDQVWTGIQGYNYPTYYGLYAMNYGLVTPTWVPKTVNLPTGANPYLISMAKNNPNTIYLAGTNSTTKTPLVLKSTNGGTSFTDIFKTTNNANISTGWAGSGGNEDWTYGEFALGFSCSSTNPLVAVLSDYGFVHITTDGGTSWKQIYTSITNKAGAQTSKTSNYSSIGIENSKIWCVNEGLDYPGYYFPKIAGTSDFGVINGSNPYFLNTGLTEKNIYRIISKRGPSPDYYYAATSSVRDLYQAAFLDDLTLDAGTGKVMYSTNQGSNWSVLHDFGHPVVWIEFNKNNEKEMYASVVNSKSGGIYFCSDITLNAKSVWTKLSNPARTAGHPFNIRILNDGSILCSYSGQRDASGNFTATSGVFLSTDKGASWKDISDNGMQYWTKDIIYDKHNENIFYAAVCSGWGGGASGLGGLYKTTNRGTSWTKILDIDNVESMTIHPFFIDRMYVTTGFDGLWVTDFINSVTPSFHEISEFPFQHPLRVYFDYNVTTGINLDGLNVQLMVTTFGNGIRYAYNEYVTDVAEINENENISLFPNPAVDKINISNKLNNEVINKIEGYSVLGERIYDSGNILLNNGTSFSINFNESTIESNNFVILKIFTNDKTYYKKMIINK